VIIKQPSYQQPLRVIWTNVCAHCWVGKTSSYTRLYIRSSWRHHEHCIVTQKRCLGGRVVSVLATGLKCRGFKPGRSDGYLRAIKIRSTPSFVQEIKPQALYRKILMHIKNPLTYLTYWYAKFSLLLPFILVAPRCLCQPATSPWLRTLTYHPGDEK
jgi:hypothetical protein